MGLSNYPDGMSEGDLPGYWDVECECDFGDEIGHEGMACTNPDCDGGLLDARLVCGCCHAQYEVCPFCEGTGMVDSRDRGRDLDYEPSEPWD